MNIAECIKEVKAKNYITAIPIEEFKDIKQLEELAKRGKAENIGISLKYETSNFHCGVLVQVYDKENCKVKEFLG